MNLVIVDDESRIRREVGFVVDWDSLGVRIVCQAANGADALEYVESHVGEVDIVITDVEMPVMDGLELSRVLAERFPSIGVFVLSGHEKFKYAREALQNGVRDYLLKPIDEQRLVKCILRFREEFSQRRVEYPDDIETQLVSLIKNNRQDEVDGVLDSWFFGMMKKRLNMDQKRKLVELVSHRIEGSVLPAGVTIWDISNEDDFHSLYREAPDEQVLRSALHGAVSVLMDHSHQLSSRTLIDQIKNYIQLNPHLDLKLSLVAREFLINPSYLSQLFKKYHDGGFSGYILQLKIDKAKRLLEDDHLKISEVGEHVGYKDIKYFSRLFKKKTGVLPSAYRQINCGR